MNKSAIKIGSYLFLFLLFSNLAKAEVSPSLQANFYTDNFFKSDFSQPSYDSTIRLLPDLKFSTIIKEWNLDGNVSVNLWYHSKQSYSEHNHFVSEDFDIEAHRAWLRASNSNSEIRLGLQKINFGPAKISDFTV